MTKQTTQELEYFDMDGNAISLWSLVRKEPDWAVSRLTVMREGEEKRDSTIAELRKEVERLEKLNADYIWFTRDEVKGLDENQTGIIDLAKLKLEMQAKGIEDMVKWYELNCNKHGLAHSLDDIAPNYVNRLRQQAKGLK